MTKKYYILELYRIALDETWDEFGSRLSREIGVTSSAIYKIAMGITKTPHARTVNKLKKWLDENRAEIDQAIEDVKERVA